MNTVTGNATMVKGKDQNQRAVRLTFSYQDERVKLMSKQILEMIPPSSDALQAREKESGFWYELKDAKNQTLFRRVIESPIKYYIEVRSDDPDRPFTWEKVANPSGIFVLLAPEIRGAQEIVLFSSPEGDRTKPAREIARFPLGRDEKGKEG